MVEQTQGNDHRLPYRGAITLGEVIAAMRRHGGMQFDPVAPDALIRVIEREKQALGASRRVMLRLGLGNEKKGAETCPRSTI